ncbi:class I SAM-dependent methyltransferase [Paenibacillus lycopersici]|uniref:Class I SAM-dependent methyltransferase n=1 Tax=Paenibacillus lycopersici TaxID=2704462 RepID=A0A6C0FWZ3_9BACL|nr:class I SAM-dependent methyltransferase [Paenibacillus lycopersici]QHT59479.1 class I SAM-dependent methyltransferase [Paenibacillus lycopersici]
MDNMNQVRSTFDATAGGYDAQRRKLIPCFDDFYGTAVSLADTEEARPRILDLGAGTGLLASMLLRKHPEARLTLIDLSDNMLSVAKERFSGREGIEYLCQDYTAYAAGESYDCIVSSLSIHHLPDEGKQAVYRNAYANLKPGGVFINADQVLGRTPFVDALYKEDWKRKIEASGLTRAELDAACERTKLDRMAGLEEQLAWLAQAGFSDVACVYQSFNFVVLYGRKRRG